MQYPTIKYPVIRYRVQTKNDCAVFAISRLMELVLRQRHVDKKINEDDLEEKFILWGAKESDNKGTYTTKALDALREHGYQGFKFGYSRIKNNVTSAKRVLKRTPILARLRCYRKKSERVVNGYFKAFPRTKQIASGHVVVLIGWNGEGFEVQDSNYDFTYIMKPEEFKASVRGMYTIRI